MKKLLGRESGLFLEFRYGKPVPEPQRSDW